MRTFQLIAALAAAAALAGPGYASAQSGTDTPALDTSTTVRVPAPVERYQLPPRDFKYYKGNYRLSNGKYMWVSDLGRRYFAQVDGERRVELIPVGYNVFVVRDSDRIVMFDQDHNGEHNDVLIRSRARVAG
ncbi:hypothetical protein HHL21_17805 [Massilia sp. RP-1-19]|uniref:Uncharacterized protein n=1 Tax=Massilia polaris TaxID=2728846 RepID=A0A848HS27_9BURK|nr:hypothetical protein [Massilia polaris]NML62899.1 hypothetical protein [Massilia polaris]